MSYPIRIMELEDYDRVYRLWSMAEGMSPGDDDNREGIALYLRRNPQSCFVALDGTEIVGVILSGHEGRRGILRHLVVERAYRNKGIAASLVQACFDALLAEGIQKCNIFVMDDNRAGLKFWEHIGFYRLEDNYRTLQHRTQASLRHQGKEKIA
jgi:ribosomal protein S18 acetylase RimI-like enzyme